MNDVILEVSNLSYSYGEDEGGIRNINLKVRRNERIAVLGPNGAGKSTLFLNLNGVYHSHEGKLFFDGQEITGKKLNFLRSKVGFVFQEPDSQIVASTVKSEVAFGPVNLKLEPDEIEGRVADAIEAMNLGGYEARPPHYLSGGEKKRVSIAGVLAMEPEVILFDEPTAALDPRNAQMLEKLLDKLWQEKKTLIISTHDVDFAYKWADRIIVIIDGQIEADDIPVEIFRNEDILKRAHLSKPALLQVYDILKNNIAVLADMKIPRNMQDFEEEILADRR